MSNKFPLESDAFSGGSRLTAQQESEGRDGAPLYDLLNQAASSAEASEALAANVDLSAATAAVVAAANRQVSTNSGAARTYTLPDFGDAPDGWEHTFIALDGASNTYSVDSAGADTINGVAGDLDLAADHEWAKVMKIPGTSGWTAIGGTLRTPA